MRSLRGKLVTLAGVVALLAAPAVAGALGGFQGPLFGLGTAPNGDLLVADASTGIITVKNDSIVRTISRPGVTDVSAIGSGTFWVTTGAGADPTADTGQGLWRVSNGGSRLIVNLFAFEEAVNPDGHIPGHDVPDSNPFDVQSLGGGAALVVDAGGNDLLHVNNRGQVKVLAVFPDEVVSTQNIKDLADCPPDSMDFPCFLPEMMPAEAVPTSVAIGPDGWYYVGELKGFPGPTGESRIWKVAPNATGADCPNPRCVLVFDGGFTSIIDLAFGPDGNLYVAELDEASWAAVEIFGTPVGGTINSCDLSSKMCVEVATDIIELTAITFGKDGSLWATRNAVSGVFGPAEVFEID